MKTKKSITARIVLVTVLAVVFLAVGLVFTMTVFMDSLTDSILLTMLQPMAKTAAQDVQSNLHTLGDRLFLIRDTINPEASKEEKQMLLEQARTGIEFVWLGIYEPNGALLTGCSGSPQSIAGRSLYTQIRETKNLVIADPSVGTTSGLEIVIGVPIMAQRQMVDGTTEEYLAYFLVGSYKYDVLRDVLSIINIGANGTAFVINQNNTLVAHLDSGKVISRESIANSLGDGDDVQAVLTKMGERQTGSDSIASESGELLVSYAPIRGTLWSLGISVPRSDFMAPVQQAVLTSGMFIVIALVLFVAVMIILIQRLLTAPLHAIAANAYQLAQGNFNGVLPKKITRRRDEIGQLGGAFISMSDTVQSVVRDIGQLTDAARAGALDTRVQLTDQQGAFLLICDGINATMDVVCAHLDFMPGALALFNGRQELVYFNRAMETALARHEQSLNHAHLLASIVSSGKETTLNDEAARLFGANGSDGDTYQADVVILDQDGENTNYTLSLKRIGSSTASHDICVMLVLSDVTILTRARYSAESASRAKGEFLSNMSHEMRTPMNAIIGMTNIAKTSSSIERKDYCLNKIDDASVHLLGVINDILDMSKIEANKFELSYAEFDFEKMLQKVVNVINFRVDERQQDFTVHVDKKIPRTLMGDDQRLAQVITNLLSNAVKFTPEQGSVRLNAGLVREENGICTLQIDVIDKGIGITEEQQARLFQSFTQADSGISRKFGGTGLGLVISKNIIELMGGTIWVESEYGKGSTFSFTIQAERAHSEPQAQLSAEINWRTVKLLVVDDDPAILEYFIDILAHTGAHCDTALNSEAACKLIDQNGVYNVIFVDWKMPGMNGIELTRLIKEKYGNEPIVIMISATEWSHIEDEATQAGVDKFLPKPLFPSAVFDCIANCMSSGLKREVADNAQTQTANFKGRRILLAEDVEINREIVLALLEPTELDIDCAENGAEAVRLFREAPDRYDMIFMDIQMPELDGYQATAQIRALDIPTAKTIPIVAMTANVFREDIEKCLNVGMNDHVGKPLDFNEVLSRLEKYLPKT